MSTAPSSLLPAAAVDEEVLLSSVRQKSSCVSSTQTLPSVGPCPDFDQEH